MSDSKREMESWRGMYDVISKREQEHISEISRLRDVIDCGCNAITDAVELGRFDKRRIRAMVKRMRNEMFLEATCYHCAEFGGIVGNCAMCSLHGEEMNCDSHCDDWKKS